MLTCWAGARRRFRRESIAKSKKQACTATLPSVEIQVVGCHRRCMTGGELECRSEGSSLGEPTCPVLSPPPRLGTVLAIKKQRIWTRGLCGWDDGCMKDLKASLLPPSREEVAAQWRALAAGDVTREAVHGWAAQWVEGEGASVGLAPLVLTALQHLHGFDLCRDPSRPGVHWHGASGEGEWVNSLDDIAGGLARWQETCDLYDADPQGWSQTVREQVRALVRAREAGAERG